MRARLITLLLPAALLFPTTGLAPVRGTPPQDLAERIAAFESAFDAANRLAGVLLIARGDSVLFERAYGMSDPVRGVPFRPDTPVPIASITKTFTQALVVHLALTGRLRPTDPIARFVPEFPRGDSITVAHLMNHRAGIPHRVTAPADEGRRWTAAEITRLAARFDPVVAIGSVSAYSTAGYAVLARVLEVAGERPYHLLLDSLLFRPAGMTHARDLSDPRGAAPVGSYLPRNGVLVPGPARDLSYLVGGGSSVATARDLFRFVQALRQGRLAPVRFEHLVPRGTVSWLGASAGYFSAVDLLPDSVTVIWVGNSWGGAAPALRSALPALLRGEPAAPPVIPPRTPMPDAAALAAYAGHYVTRPGATTVVRVEDGLRYDDNFLVPIGSDRFWLPSTSQPIEFLRDAGGSVVSLARGAGADRAVLPRAEPPRPVR